jgi:hypothetical protein
VGVGMVIIVLAFGIMYLLHSYSNYLR